jgi:hypothetical protein
MRSYANGGSMSNGNSAPAADWRRHGWDIRPVTHWDLTIGRDPA